jgi:hypothetical protein
LLIVVIVSSFSGRNRIGSGAVPLADSVVHAPAVPTRPAALAPNGSIDAGPVDAEVDCPEHTPLFAPRLGTEHNAMLESVNNLLPGRRPRLSPPRTHIGRQALTRWRRETGDFRRRMRMAVSP